jgi:hypothetical protein
MQASTTVILYLIIIRRYKITLNMHCGLAYMDKHPFINKDWDHLPHIVALMLKTPWVLDLEQSNALDWFEWTLTHMQITVTTLLARVQHLCQIMRRPLQISKTIPCPHGNLLLRMLLIMLLNCVSCRLTCTALSMLAPKLAHKLGSESADDDMFCQIVVILN